MNYGQLYQKGVERLLNADVTEPENDARILLLYVCNINTADYILKRNVNVPAAEEKEYFNLIKKRESHIPVQHIMGKAYFYGFEFLVNEHVLIPRFDTEVLAETVLKHYRNSDISVLDMCTGSGCIGITLKLMGKYKTVCASDYSREAILTARENADRLNADISFFEGNLFENVKGLFDVIVSNPPYIRPEVIEALDKEVKEHEPYSALYGGVDGLDFYRRITQKSKDYLKAGGGLFFEIGFDQAEDVSRILIEEEFKNIKVKNDLAGLPRVVWGFRGQE